MNTPQGVHAEEPPTPDQQITLRIKGLMGQRDLSRRKLADLAGLSHVTLGRRLIGSASWDIETLEHLAQVLEVDLTWLLTGIVITNDPTHPGGGAAPSLLPDLNRRPSAYKGRTLTSVSAAPTTRPGLGIAA